MIDLRRRCVLALAGAVCLAPLGCHSAFVNVTVVNDTGSPVRLIEVDYPSASFGTEDLAAGAVYHYRFKILGNGSTHLSWTDAREQDHNSTGPTLQEGQEGDLSITLEPNGATWQPRLRQER